MVKIEFSAIIDGINARKDKTLSIKLGTQELGTEETPYLFDLMGKQIWIAIGETPIESLNIPEIIPEMQGDKTPAQRMRAILYKIWELKTDKKEAWPKFYDNYMFKVCEQLKQKLD